MTLIIALNAILCFGVIAVVVSPLIWAILTQHRDHVALAPATAFGPKVLTDTRPYQHPRHRVRRPEVAVA
jgi:hypothetical protein